MDMEEKLGKNHVDKKMDLFIGIICTIYDICVIGFAIIAEWPQKYVILLVVNFGLMWHFILNMTFGEKIKKVLCCLTMMTTVLMCAVNGMQMLDVTIMLITITVVLGVWGEKNLVFFTLIMYTFMFMYYVLIADSETIKNYYYVIASYLKNGVNVGVVCYVMYTWNKNRTEVSKIQQRNIQYLKAIEKSKDEFLANISHEIRTPINTINGMSDIAMNESDMTEVKKKIAAIKNAGRNLMAVISDIFDFSELQSNEIEVAEEVYSMTSVVNDVLNMTGPWKGDKNIEIIVNYDVYMPNELIGDEQKVKRILVNMVSNAIKFTNKGGVAINISHRVESYGVNLCLEVRDTGIGMSKEFMEELFYTYNALTLSTKASGGVGFGIAVMKLLVEKMGGVIELDSRLGRGSVIRAVIPQRIASKRSSVDIRDYSSIKIITYLEIQRFKMMDIRDEYTKCISNMAKQLEMNFFECRTFNDVKRQIEKGGITHIVTAVAEYVANREYFEKISNEIQIMVAVDKKNEKLNNNNLIYLIKPFTVVNLANAFNEYLENGVINNGIQKFTGKDVKVLAVDDNEVNIMVLKGLVEKYEIQIDSALSGFEAVQKIESKDYDFVFMDHMMPGMDGIQTLKAIRKKEGEYFKKVPIIALTANALSGRREMFMHEGFDDFLDKPIDVVALERMIYKFIPKNKLVIGKVESSVVREDDFDEHIRDDGGEEQLASMVDKEMGQYNKKEMIGKLIIKYLDDFDVEKGKLYCGGEENYFMIMEKTLPQIAEVRKKIISAYEDNNWAQYTVNVHGLKGIMLNLGESILSDLALKLEKASRNSDIDYIDINHENMLIKEQEIEKRLGDFINELKSLDATKGANINKVEKKKEEDLSQLHALEDDEFDDIVTNFENAAYEFNEEKMIAIVEQMRNLAYKGKVLSSEMDALMYKIKMADYLSASESMVNLKKKLKAGDSDAR